VQGKQKSSNDRSLVRYTKHRARAPTLHTYLHKHTHTGNTDTKNTYILKTMSVEGINNIPCDSNNIVLIVRTNTILKNVYRS